MITPSDRRNVPGVGWFLTALLGLAAQASSLPTDGLLWHGEFEQSTRADFARGKPDALEQRSVAFVPGYQGRALRLSLGYVEYDAAAHVPSAEGTLAGWVSLDPTRSSRGLRALFTWGDPSSDSFAVTFSPGGRSVRVLIRPWVREASSLAEGAINPQPGEWNHLAVTWRYPQLRLFWNGELVANARLRSVVGRRAARFRLGSPSGQSTAPFLAVDDLRLYDRAFNERELSVIIGRHPRPRLVRADLLQRDFEHAAQAIPWALQLRGELTDRHRLRLEVAGQPAVTIPWTDAPVFVLDHPLSPGASAVSLALLEGDSVLDRVSDEVVCLPPFALPLPSAGASP